MCLLRGSLRFIQGWLYGFRYLGVLSMVGLKCSSKVVLGCCFRVGFLFTSIWFKLIWGWLRVFVLDLV